MKIILVTNTQPRHFFWINSLMEIFRIDGIILVNPINRKSSFPSNKILDYSFWYLLKVMSFIRSRINSENLFNRLRKKERIRFTDHEEKFNRMLSENGLSILKTNDINSAEALQWINSISPDIICFLGGDLAKKRFFNNTEALVLNYHSGISPFFNGSGTTFHAFVSSSPTLCGGTLMVMNEKIDGGNILGYYFPSISINDTPESLFLKGIEGSVKLYADFLLYFKKNMRYHSLVQPKSLLYFRAYDWNIYHDLKDSVACDKRMTPFIRDEKILRVYDDERKNLKWLYFEILDFVL